VGEPELLTFQFFQPVTCVRNIRSKSLSSYQIPLTLIFSKAPKIALDSKTNQVDTFPLNMYTY
jgi:hypothetical protein